MSIKFKQNGEWVKIPTPSQIDDTAASSATTYSSNKINEIIPKDIAEYIEEHKEEIGTTDFNKLKNVPFTTITESDRLNYNTLDKLCHLSDGVYLYNGTTAIELHYKSQDLFKQAIGSDGGTQDGTSLVFDETIHLENGTVFSVYTGNSSVTNSSERTIAIMSGVRQNTEFTTGYFLINANPDSGSGTEADPYVYGTTGVNCSTSDVGNLGVQGGATVLSLFKSLFSETPPTDGQVAQFKTDETSPLGVTIQGADVGSSVPITVINADNYENFTTLDKICHQPDGLYIVDDCGTTSSTQDYEFEIDGVKGVNMVSAYVNMDMEVSESQSIRFKKGSTIQIYSWETTRKRVNIYNTEGGQGYDADHGIVGNLIFHIETLPESGKGTEADPYVYGVIGSTTWYMDSNEYDVYNLSALSLVLSGLLGGSSAEAKSLVGIADGGMLGTQFVSVAMDDFQSPFTVITNDTADNYNTLDKLCHLADGVYICKDEYTTAKKDYIVEVSFKGIDYYSAVQSGFIGDTPTPDSNGTTQCKNGAIISVATKTDSTKDKIIRITHGLNCNMSGSGTGFQDIYIMASPDDSSTSSTLVYGVTGENVFYYRPFSQVTIMGNTYPINAMMDTLMSGDEADGKMAVWKKQSDTAEMPSLSYADIPTGGSSPINVVNDDNWSNFDTLEKWFNADPGVYYIDLTKQSDGFVKPFTASYTYTNPFSGEEVAVTDKNVYMAQRTLVYHTLTNDSWSGSAHYHHLFVMDIDATVGLGTGNDPQMLCDFVWDIRNTYSAENVKLRDYGSGAAGISELTFMIMYLYGTVGGSISSSDIGKIVKIGSPSSSDYGNEFEFQATDLALVGESTAVTPAQVKAAIEEGQPVTISHTDSTYGTLTFTGFGMVTTASGTTVSASITYGTGTDSFMLFTLMGDVTGGTWTMYSRSVPTMESIG